MSKTEVTLMNILLLTADSLRADRTSLFDYSLDTTPFIKSIAEDGLEFDQAYSNGHNTGASFPSIFCSTYWSKFRGSGIPESNHPVLAERLAVDHRTFGITTNELLSRDYNYNRGFDTYIDSRSPYGSKSSLRIRLRDAIGDGPLFELAKKIHFVSTRRLGIKLFNTADAESGFSKSIIDWVTDIDDDWFVWAHFMNPHHPYEPPEESQRALGFEPVSTRRATKLSRKMRRHPDTISSRENETINRLYDASVHSFDQEVEELITHLDTINQLDDTLLIITADHGELLGEEGLYGHPTVLKQELLRVPLVINGFDRSEQVKRPVELLDIAPTILNVVGSELPNSFQGKPLLNKEGDFLPDSNGTIIAETTGEENRKICAIRENQKLVYHVQDDRWEAFSLSNYGLEETVVESKNDQLRNDLFSHVEWSEENQVSGAEVDETQLEADLKALGYLEE